MKKNEMKKIENLLKEFDFDILLSENDKYLLSKKNYEEMKEYLSENQEDISIDSFEIKSQIHQKLDRDIKIDSKKIDIYNIKLIYHRKKDDSKEYRLFISYKDENKKLIRKRMINDNIKKIQDNEDSMIELFNKINKNQILKSLSI